MTSAQPVPVPQTAPVMARLLGYAGGLPFAGCALAGALQISLAGFDPFRLLLAYGAVILSFLGGLHWGRIAADDGDDAGWRASLWLVWSVLPSLAGWAALIMPPLAAIVVLSGGFGLALLVDLRRIGESLPGAPRWPVWMHRLRRHLTLVAMASLLSSLFWV